MKTSRTISIIMLFSVLLSACAQAAEPTLENLVGVVEEESVQGERGGEDYYQPLPLPTSGQIAVQPAESYPDLPPLPTATPGAISTPGDNYFQDYGVNPYVDTYEDHLSTFALDVDTASYSVMRRYIRDGNLPPAEAVRVEEFVNYFDQGYPNPPEVAFGIYADGAPSPFHYDSTYILRFGVQGYQVPEWERKPATLTFVIDISGSMDLENRLGLVKDSLRLLVDRLRADDSVAIVVYGSDARVVLRPTRGDDRSSILNTIYALRTEGATNAEAGLRLGYQLAMQAFRPGTNNRVILCSDGVANVGLTGPEAILETVRGYVDEGVYLTTVGFGMGNFNDVLMEQLADNGNGSYAYVDTLDEAEKLFVNDLTSTLEVIARDAKVQVDFNPGVVAYYRLIGYENRDVADQDFRNDNIDAGEIGAGHSATALYAVQLKSGAQGRIATIQLRWEDPKSHQVQEINGNFNTWDLAPSFESAAPHYRLAMLVGTYAEVLRHSPWMRGISMDHILGYVSALVEYIPGDAEVAEFVGLVSRAAQITR